MKTILWMILFPAVLFAQLISIKTVPVADGDQFLIFPSQNQGMGNVSIALDDPLLDPFVNPAKGYRIQGMQLISSPIIYSISDHNGSTRTMPVSALAHVKNWFMALSTSLQEIKQGGPSDGVMPTWYRFEPLSERSLNNFYYHASLGRNIINDHTALAIRLFQAKLNGIDGVQMLYPGSQGLKQFGKIIDLRLGFISTIKNVHTIEALLLHNRFNMTHEVAYETWTDDILIDRWMPVRKVETNLDHSRTWGLHLGYIYNLPQYGWKIGTILTLNRKTHPKIPNYELMRIPRDPGNSFAYNFGLGFSKHFEDKTIFGMDIIYEPIWSNTWANAESATATRTGQYIPAGGKTIDNDFWFSNKIFRFGFSTENERVVFQLGLQIHTISYRLKQYDYVAERLRSQSEHWVEWVPGWGFAVKLKHLRIKYQGRITFGTGRPGIANFSTAEDLDYAKSADFLLAPAGALSLADVHVLTNQIIISMPIGN